MPELDDLEEAPETDSAESPDDDTTDTETTDEAYGLSDEELLKQAKKRFQQALESTRDDFEMTEQVQDFIAGDQWPSNIKAEREQFARPCLTLDHLSQYVRHVVNSGLMRRVDVRVLPLNEKGDDQVAEIIAGMVRQIVQTSTAKVAYETGLRHACQVGFGYWRVKAVPSGCEHPTEGTPLLEITIRRISDPRMVIMDPFTDYPDGRDARYAFLLTKLAKDDYKEQYGDEDDESEESPQSWHMLDGKEVLPWVGDQDTCVVAEYYYKMKDGTMCWAIITPDKVLSKGIHHGNAMPIIRVVGEEYEADGKARRRGMIEPAMDAQRAYNYSSSAVIESAALAPIAPFVAADGQIEQFLSEWKDAHRVPRAVLRYKPVSAAGQLTPPPMRVEPAGISPGWQATLQNLIGDTQMIMGMGQPSVSGMGGSGQTGPAVTAEQAPGDVNTYHFHEHWFQGIEQTGRVILSMIPEVYTLPQAVKIVGDDGVMQTALLNPGQEEAVAQTGIQPGAPMNGETTPEEGAADMAAYAKIFDKSYNPCVGKYDVAISLGPSSATKKQEANKMLMTILNASPQLMPIIGDLVFSTMDIAGADQIAKRLRQQDGHPTPEQLQQMKAQMQQLEQQNSEMEKLLLAEQQKSAASLQKAKMDNQTKLAEAQLDAEVQLEIAARANINALLLEKMKGNAQISNTIIKALAEADKEQNRVKRMTSYSDVTSQLSQPVQ